MKKKRCIIIILFFILLTFLESGIFIEVAWHGWGGFGGVSLEYTAEGQTGISFLICTIPVCVIIIFLIRIALCIKKIRNMREFFYDCISSLFGIGFSIGLFFILPYIAANNPIFELGRRIAAFFIDHFNWMDIPIP